MSDHIGAKIIAGLNDAIAGNFARVTIDGQAWVRETPEIVAERDELKSIRDLFIKALITATGYSETAIRDAPLTCASASAAERDCLRAIVAQIQPPNDIGDNCTAELAIKCAALEQERDRLRAEVERLKVINAELEIAHRAFVEATRTKVEQLTEGIRAAKGLLRIERAEKMELENTINRADDHTAMLMTEIDRLHTVNAKLEMALRKAAQHFEDFGTHREGVDIINAALAKAGMEQKE